MSKEERVIKLVEYLDDTFEIRTFQDHDPYRVLVRTILSQRTRDENTDQATNNLFSKYKDIYEVAEAPIDDVLYGRKNGTWDKIPDSINIYKTITDADVPNNNTVILNIDEIKNGDCIVINRSNIGANTFVKFNEKSFASLTLPSGIYQFVYINSNNIYIIGNNRFGIYYYGGPLDISQSHEYIFSLDEVKNIVYKNRENTIYGTITFTTTPKFTKAPTTDEEATNKKYVDALPTTYAGYDATKTQVLKNINGVLTWQDE